MHLHQPPFLIKLMTGMLLIKFIGLKWVLYLYILCAEGHLAVLLCTMVFKTSTFKRWMVWKVMRNVAFVHFRMPRCKRVYKCYILETITIWYVVIETNIQQLLVRISRRSGRQSSSSAWNAHNPGLHFMLCTGAGIHTRQVVPAQFPFFLFSFLLYSSSSPPHYHYYCYWIFIGVGYHILHFLTRL